MKQLEDENGKLKHLVCGFNGSLQHFNLFEKDGVFMMKYRTRTFYTNEQKSEMWDRWQRGESMGSIGRHFNRASSSIFPHLAQFGGIRPPDRKRSRHALSLIEREEISRGLVAKQSFRSIAQSLKRSPSTIGREVRRNGGRQAYRAAPSDQRAWDSASRPKLCKLSFNGPLCERLRASCAGNVSDLPHLFLRMCPGVARPGFKIADCDMFNVRCGHLWLLCCSRVESLHLPLSFDISYELTFVNFRRTLSFDKSDRWFS